MNDYKYSLCLALDNLAGDSRFYRIADYNPDEREFTQATYDNTTQTPLQISSAKNDGINNQVEIRKWIGFDERIQQSIKETLRYGYIYEIVFADSLIHQPLNDDQLRQVLYDGIHLPDGIQRYFLLVLDVTSNSYKVILCDKEAFIYENGKYRVEKQVKTLKNIIKNFPILYVFNDQLISTETPKNMLKWYDAETRYFYQSILLPEQSSTFELRGPEDYVIGFFADSLNQEENQLKYTTNYRTEIVTELKTITEGYDLIDQFFNDQNSNFREKSQISIDYIKVLIEYLKQEEPMQDMFFKILKNDETLRRRFENIIEAKWMSKYNQNILDKENELSLIQTEYEKELKNFNALKRQKELAYQESDEATKKLKELQKQNTNLEKQLHEEFNHFQNNVVEQLKLASISYGLDQKPQKELAMLTSDTKTEQNVRYFNIRNLKDILKGLIFNLENIMSRSDAIRYALITLATTKARKLLVIPEFESQSFADSLSLSLAGQPAKVINILNDEYNLEELIESVNSYEKGFTLIKGQLDLFNETSVNALINQCNHRNIIFSINNEKSVSLFSSNFWAYFVYLNPVEVMNLKESKRWVQAKENSDELLKTKTISATLSSSFEGKFMSEYIFTPFVQEEMLKIIRIYTQFYEEMIKPNYQVHSIADIPLSHQILSVNHHRAHELEDYYISLGFDSKLLNFYM